MHLFFVLQLLLSKILMLLQVNGELKNLLVAAVGEDLETRVHLLTEDKLQLARALLNSAQRLSTHQEQTEWLAGQCEVWRSKFLASRSVSLHTLCFPDPHTAPLSHFSFCCCNLSIRMCVNVSSQVSFHDVFNWACICYLSIHATFSIHFLLSGQFIPVTVHCYNLGDFSKLMLILSVIVMYPVQFNGGRTGTLESSSEPESY